MQLTEQHEQLRDSVVRFIQNEINPFVDEWEKAEDFPSHEVFKKLGALGVLGVKYDEAYGGLGLDFSYSAVVAEALGVCSCGGVPMAIGVQSDMATPALHRFGSEDLKRNWLVPTIAGDGADSCLQYWGGMGYAWDNPLSRALRDGRLVSIGGGADEIMLGIICKLEGTLPREKKEEPHEPAPSERAFA
jgi:citronellyl-CoA dehydrogenase